MKFVTTVGELLKQAVSDNTPKVKSQFVARDQNGVIKTCIWGGALLNLGIDATKLDGRTLDEFIELDGMQIPVSAIKDEEVRDHLRKYYGLSSHSAQINLGSAAMSLNDSTDLPKKQIAAALLDAMTQEQIEHAFSVDVRPRSEF